MRPNVQLCYLGIQTTLSTEFYIFPPIYFIMLHVIELTIKNSLIFVSASHSASPKTPEYKDLSKSSCFLHFRPPFEIVEFCVQICNKRPRKSQSTNFYLNQVKFAISVLHLEFLNLELKFVMSDLKNSGVPIFI